MSYDENDAARDAFYDEMREQFYPEIVDEFTTERLQSYFLSYPEDAKPAYIALEEALRLRDAGFFPAALLIAVIATEIAIKVALLKPIVHGLVHDVAASTLIAELVLGQTGLDRFKKLLFNSLNTIANVNLDTFCRPNSAKTLWNEFAESQARRNLLSHQAKMPSQIETETAIAVASTILNDIFPSVIKAINFHQHEYGRICNDSCCALEGKYPPELVEKLRSGHIKPVPVYKTEAH